MKEGGGSLFAEYPSASGTWDYNVYYDMPDSLKGGLIEIKAGDNEPVRVEMDPLKGTAEVPGVVMTGGERVSFLISAPEGAEIRKIEIIREKQGV